MERNDIKKVALEYYLGLIGYKPVLTRADDLWYFSPFRDEATPSFKVNRTKNVWYDFGLGKGGDIFSFAEIYYPKSPSFPELISLLSQSLEGSPVVVWQKVEETTTKEHKLVITEVCDKLNDDMRLYLMSRGIVSPYLHSMCSAVYYRVGERNYHAVGFRNDSGGYELRSRYFKGSSSPKDITTVYDDNYTDTCCVFEGFIDYLSFLTIGREEFAIWRSNFIVMNSLIHAKKILPLLGHYNRVCCFLDNDTAGKHAFSFFTENLQSAKDMSEFYACSKDLNEYLCTSIKQR